MLTNVDSNYTEDPKTCDGFPTNYNLMCVSNNDTQ